MKRTMISLWISMLLITILFQDTQSRQNNNDNAGTRIINEICINTAMIAQYENIGGYHEPVMEGDTISEGSLGSPNIIDSVTVVSSYTFSGDKVIRESETINGNVEVKGGDLTIYGKVNGNVLVVGGDLRMKQTGKISGNARVVNGSIFKDSGAVIEGYEDRTSEEKKAYRETRRNFLRGGRSFDVPWRDEQVNMDNFVFRYNRVESVFLGLGTEKKFNWDGERVWNAYGSFGWGFKSHTWRGNLGLARQFALISEKGSSIIEVGIEGYSLTDTKDQWIISLHENSMSAFLIHEDFRDYFERRGYTLHTAYYIKHDNLKSEVKLEYRVDTYDSLSNKVDWSLFGGDKKFRLNPAIDPGNMRSLIVSGGVSKLSKTSYGPKGWSAHASSEFAKGNWGSKFEFDRYVLDARWFHPIGRYDNLNIRLRIGSACGALPLQKTYELGGLGTLNAFPFKSEMGNRMLLINAEFIVNGSVLDDLDFWPTWIFRHVNFMLISDAGFTRNVSPGISALEGFNHMHWNEFKHDFGIAFSNRPGSFRIGLAWRTDRSAPVQFLLRFNRPF